jgi:hypothetical protein
MQAAMEPIISVSADDGEPLDDETFALLCKALGHPARIRILQYLKKTDRCICAKIVEILPLAERSRGRIPATAWIRESWIALNKWLRRGKAPAKDSRLDTTGYANILPTRINWKE